MFIVTDLVSLTTQHEFFFFRNFYFGYKSYLDLVSVDKFRFAMSRLRLSSHCLEIETTNCNSVGRGETHIIYWKMSFIVH